MNRVIFYLIFTFSVFSSPVFAQTADIYIQNGDMLHSEFRNPEALEQYKKAYELEPDQFEILKRLTLTSNDTGEDLRDTDMERARAYFKESVTYAELAREKFPEEEEVYFLLAISYGNMARYAKGKQKVKLARNVEQNLQRMIELRPDFAPSYIALGIYYREVSKLNWFLKKFAASFFGGLPDGNLEDSRDAFLKALDLEPDFIITHYEIGKTYLDMKDEEKAKYHFNKVLELDVKDHSDQSKKYKVNKMISGDNLKAGKE